MESNDWNHIWRKWELDKVFSFNSSTVVKKFDDQLAEMDKLLKPAPTQPSIDKTPEEEKKETKKPEPEVKDAPAEYGLQELIDRMRFPKQTAFGEAAGIFKSKPKN